MFNSTNWRSFVRSFGGLCSILFSVGLVAYSVGLPSTEVWARGKVAVVILVVLGVITAIYQPFVNVGNRSRRRRARLDDACLRVADHMDSACPGIPLRSIGVHIWGVRGFPGLRSLRRVGQFLLRERASSDVTWREGKGVMGIAWRERSEVIVDLEAELYPQMASAQAAGFVASDESLGLKFDEIQRTKKYKAIFATPLMKGKRVLGILAIDVLQSGSYTEFKQATWENADLNSILGVCQNALRSD